MTTLTQEGGDLQNHLNHLNKLCILPSEHPPQPEGLVPCLPQRLQRLRGVPPWGDAALGQDPARDTHRLVQDGTGKFRLRSDPTVSARGSEGREGAEYRGGAGGEGRWRGGDGCEFEEGRVESKGGEGAAASFEEERAGGEAEGGKESACEFETCMEGGEGGRG